MGCQGWEHTNNVMQSFTDSGIQEKWTFSVNMGVYFIAF